MEEKNMTPADRVREALKGKTRGYRGPLRGIPRRPTREHVEVLAGDIVAICESVPEDKYKESQIVRDLHKGHGEGKEAVPLEPHPMLGCSGLPPETMVAILADDAFHLLDLIAPAAPAAPAAPVAPAPTLPVPPS